MIAPEVRAVKEALVVGKWHNLCIGLWSDRPSIPAVDELERQYSRMAHDHGAFAVLIIVEDGVPVPDEPSRRAISRAMREFAGRINAMCGVQEATGFRGAALRSAITAMAMMSRAPYKTTTVATADQASRWLMPFIKPAPTTAQLAEAISQFRERAFVASYKASQAAFA